LSRKKKLLKITDILEEPVEVTLPRCLTKQTPTQEPMVPATYVPTQPWKKGVITAPYDIDAQHIREKIGAVWAHRITKRINEETVPTTAVKVAFEHNLPEKVYVGLHAFKVHQ
jgi:hypothetical protein